MTGFLIYILFCIIVGMIAGSKGRGGFGWFMIAVLLSPLFGILILICVGDLPIKESNNEKS